MSIYTGAGDLGETSLAGKVRVYKDEAIINMLGELDECNSFIGLLRSKLTEDHEWQIPLRDIQRDFMKFISLLAQPKKFFNEDSFLMQAKFKSKFSAKNFEKWIDKNDAEMGEAKFFILPAGTEISSLCHVIRCKIRNAERTLVFLYRKENLRKDIFSYISSYLNRLSDLFFSLARLNLHRENLSEEKWKLFNISEESKL